MHAFGRIELPNGVAGSGFKRQYCTYPGDAKSQRISDAIANELAPVVGFMLLFIFHYWL